MSNPAHSLNRFVLAVLRLGLAMEHLFAGIMIIWCSDAFLTLHQMNGSNLAGRGQYYGFPLWALTCVVLMWLRWPRSIPVIKEGKFILLFVGFVLLSTLWSTDASYTREEGIYLLQTTLYGAYLPTRYTFKQETDLFNWVFGIVAFFSILYVFGNPSLGVMDASLAAELDGKWQGVFKHKNVLGSIAATMAPFLLSKAVTASKRQWLWWGFFGLTVMLIFGADSKTAVVGFLFLMMMSPFHRIFRWNLAICLPLYLLGLMLGGIGLQLLIDNWYAAMDFLNKPPDLNGRFPLWAIVFEAVQDKPWLGYGFHGLWHSEWGEYIHQVIPWKPNHAHNGFLDVLADFGIVGFMFFAIALFNVLFKAINWIRLMPSVEGVWPIAYLTYFLLQNVANSNLVVPHTLYWLLFSVISFTPFPKGHELREPTQQIPRNPVPESAKQLQLHYHYPQISSSNRFDKGRSKTTS